MTDLRNQKRMAADLLKCGEHRVWIDPLHNEEVAQAITREDIRGLIKDGTIQKEQKEGTSRARARKLQKQKDKGRRRGPGSRKGAKGGRQSSKKKWIQNIRAIRRTLRTLRDEGHIDRSVYRKYYRKAKGGEYRSKKHLLSHLHADGVVDADVTMDDLESAMEQ